MRVRDKNIAVLESLLDNWNAEFDELEARIGKAGANLKADYDEVITALRQHRHKTGVTLEETTQYGKSTR